MSRSVIAVTLLAFAGLSASLALAAEPTARPKPKKLPKFSAVERLVRGELITEERPAGDIISQGDVAPLFGRLQKAGWTVADWDDILAAVPADDDFIVQQLRGEDGQELMRAVAGYEGGYDRLDRLSRLSDGQQIIRDLVRGPDGAKLIQYLAEEQGGREMGRMLSRAPHGEQFNRPTERIYTAEQFVARLRQSYRQASAQPPAR